MLEKKINEHLEHLLAIFDLYCINQNKDYFIYCKSLYKDLQLYCKSTAYEQIINSYEYLFK